MVRALILYEREPDAERYRQHVEESARKVRARAFRHGPVFGAPFGEPPFRYFAEFEFEDRAAFDEAARTPEFAASGRDAIEMGIPFHVLFAEID